jgi:hypothetical protein
MEYLLQVSTYRALIFLANYDMAVTTVIGSRVVP